MHTHVTMAVVMIVVLFLSAGRAFGLEIDMTDSVNTEDNVQGKTSCFNKCRVSTKIVDCSRAYCRSIPNELTNETKKLILSNSRIKYITFNSFERVPNLQYLDLSCGKIELIENGSFDGLIDLRFLNLSFNPHIRLFHDGIYSKLIGLRELLLTRTVQMCKFDNRFLRNLTGLKTLWFGRNQLTQFPNFLDNRNRSLLPNILELSLENNNIERIRGLHMIGLESLERLNLNGNRIFTVWPNSFRYLVKLHQLQMDRNFELCPKEFAFASISLTHLSLADVHTFSSGNCRLEIFNRLPNLTSLNIARSRDLLKAVYLYRTLKEVRQLNLRATGLTSDMIGRIAEKLSHLQHLDVSENEISFLQGSTLHSLKLEVLLLRDNWLSVINITTLPESTWSHLKRVDFSENTLYCDCKIVWLRRWINNRKNITVENLKLTRCTGPAEVKDVPIHLLKQPTDLECFSEERDICLLSVLIMVILIFVVAFLIALLHRLRWFLKYWYFRYKAKAKEYRELVDQRKYEFDAFISYSESDSKWVINQLRPRIENEFGLRLCIHHRDWLVGQDIVDNVVDSIAHSRKTVLIVSNAFAVSQWCHFEMTMAQTKLFEDDRDNLILVLLEEIVDCNLNPRLQLQMQKKTYIEWTDNEIGQQLFWDKLRRALVRQSKSLIYETPPRELLI